MSIQQDLRWGPIEVRRQHLVDAHRVIVAKWFEHTGKKEGDQDPAELRISTFNEPRFGRCSIIRHACGGFICLVHEFPDKVIAWSVPEEQETECNGCKKQIPFSLLTFLWMHSRLTTL